MDNNANIDYVSIDEACDILNNRTGNKTTWNKSRLFELDLEMFAWLDFSERFLSLIPSKCIKSGIARLGRYSENMQLKVSKNTADIINNSVMGFPRYKSDSVRVEDIRFIKSDIIAVSIQEADCSEIPPPINIENPPTIIQSTKPLMIRQEEEIIKILETLGIELKSLYKTSRTGTKGNRSKVKGQLNIPSELFISEGVFNKAWSRVLKNADDMRNR